MKEREIAEEANETLTKHTREGLAKSILKLDLLKERMRQGEKVAVSALIIAAKNANSWVSFLHEDDEDYETDRFRIFTNRRGEHQVVQGREQNTDVPRK